ncbi:hypothetical protein JCM13580A_11540 [Streptomyces drozdowiczii]
MPATRCSSLTRCTGTPHRQALSGSAADARIAQATLAPVDPEEMGPLMFRPVADATAGLDIAEVPTPALVADYLAEHIVTAAHELGRPPPFSSAPSSRA